MKTRTIIVTFAMCFVGLTLCFAEDANMGTWKLNEAKSTFRPGSPKNTTVVYEVGKQCESHSGRCGHSRYADAQRVDGQVRWQRLSG
jgi:hypothetical protein